MKRSIIKSKKGKKLYVIRDKKGRFVDIQSYQKAHNLDMKRISKAEKRYRLHEYIKEFAKTISGYSFPEEHWAKDWDKMCKQIDKLNLF